MGITTLPNFENDFNIFVLSMIVLLIALQSEFLRKAGERFTDWIDDTVDEINDDFGHIEQDFNR